jgi:hypothetical protein
MLIVLFLGMAPASAQVPTPTGMWGPRKNSVLYQTLIKYGTHREERWVRIWTEDQQTVFLQTIIEGKIFRYIANDQGLQEVWSCDFKDRKNRQMPPKRIILCDFIEDVDFEKDEMHSIDGRPAVRVRVDLVPKCSEEGLDIIEGFNALVKIFELEEDSR